MVNTWEETYEKWLAFENLDVQLKSELNILKSDPTKLEDAFCQELTFGTVGIQGVLGPGTNRMNIYTVRKVVDGLAKYVLEHVANAKQRGVVIGYGSRSMSKVFALEAAKVLGAYGIRTSVFSSYCPTPILSYGIRYHSAAAGIMFTSDHHSPEYNGLKVYNEEGGQIIREEEELITAAIQETEDELQVPVREIEDLEDELLFNWIGEEISRAYLEQLQGITKLDKEEFLKAKDLKIIYTPLHGTGTDLITQGLDQVNFSNVMIVKEQVTVDPELSTIESISLKKHQAFTHAVEYGKRLDADILLATDSDAERLGVAVKNRNGEYVVLTGSQLGSLLLDYILSQSDMNIYRNARFINSVVTTNLSRSIADYYGVKTIETLPGFGYIAEKIADFDSTGETFMFGYEADNGYLVNGFTRDRDAIQAAVLTAEMAHYWKSRGKSLLDALEILYEKHGYFLEEVTSFTLGEKDGFERFEEIIEEFRTHPMKEIDGIKVEKIENYLSSERVHAATGKTETIDLPKENIMKFILEKNYWICLFPSSTEPKLNCYYGVCGTSNEESVEKLDTLQQALKEIIAGITVK